ncbi:sel1 repeat family protein [Colwelliaceae bacterium 6471]
MKLKNLLFILFTVFIIGCQSTNIQRKTKISLRLDEINGIKSYQDGNYKEAFELLKTPATWGYKGAQYAIGFMFLKGQYVQQSTLLGMGWLGVATEMETVDWSDQYRSFYAAAPSEEKLKIDMIVKEYIRRYGMKAQHITCKKLNSGPALTIKHHCIKSDRLSTVYEIDLVE